MTSEDRRDRMEAMGKLQRLFLSWDKGEISAKCLHYGATRALTELSYREGSCGMLSEDTVIWLCEAVEEMQRSDDSRLHACLLLSILLDCMVLRGA